MASATQTRVQEVIAEFEAYMHQFGGCYSDWYVGITADPRQRLFGDHKVKELGDAWIYRDSHNDTNARVVEIYFHRKGCDGGGGGGDYQSRYAYAYKKAYQTEP